MNKDLDAKLVAKYPKIFANRHKSMQETAMCWGFACGDGWYNIIDALCNQIQSYIDNNPHKNVPQVVASQVKEKFGALRFYIDGGDDYIHGLIDFAETMSECTCDQCGQPGTLDTLHGWWRTRCEEHKVNDKTRS